MSGSVAKIMFGLTLGAVMGVAAAKLGWNIHLTAWVGAVAVVVLCTIWDLAVKR